MGCCSGLCKILLVLWSVVSLLFSMTMIGFMAFKLESLPKQAENPDYFHDLLVLLPGSGIYKNINMVNLTKYAWYAALGLAALMFIAAVIHIISTCKRSRCLLGLSTLLLIIAMTGDLGGVVFKFKAQESILAGLETSLNNTIVNMYGNPEHTDVTNAWNLLGNNADCCGINNGKDFEHAKYWSGDIKLDTAPCGSSIDTGCAKKIDSHFISYDNIWFTSIIAVKVFLMLLMLMHTMCVCKMGFHGNGDRDHESFRLVHK